MWPTHSFSSISLTFYKCSKGDKCVNEFRTCEKQFEKRKWVSYSSNMSQLSSMANLILIGKYKYKYNNFSGKLRLFVCILKSQKKKVISNNAV